MLNKTLAVIALSVLVGLGTFTPVFAGTQVAKQGSIARDVMSPDVHQLPAGFTQPGNSR